MVDRVRETKGEVPDAGESVAGALRRLESHVI